MNIHKSIDHHLTSTNTLDIKNSNNRQDFINDHEEIEQSKKPTDSDEKIDDKSITARLGITKETNRNVLNDLTNNDGSEDPGSELDTEFSNIANKDN